MATALTIALIILCLDYRTKLLTGHLINFHGIPNWHQTLCQMLRIENKRGDGSLPLQSSREDNYTRYNSVITSSLCPQSTGVLNFNSRQSHGKLPQQTAVSPLVPDSIDLGQGPRICILVGSQVMDASANGLGRTNARSQLMPLLKN